MEFDFDTPVSLTGTHSSKWDFVDEMIGTTAKDTIPMWIADMDFRAPPAVLATLQAEVDRGVLGYFGPPRDVAEKVADWWSERHGWSVEPSWVTFTSGVVAGLGATLDAFTDPGDGVIVFSPVYHAFFRKVRQMGREIVESPLVLNEGRYEMDLEALAASLTGSEKMVILCSPHNPGGRMWDADELRSLAAFCAAHDMILVSDEIHMDLTFPGHTHVPTAVAAPDCLPRFVVLSAASKTFNLAGGETGYAIVADPDLRKTFAQSALSCGGVVNRFGLLMTKAAYTDGVPWLDAVRTYIAGNFEIFKDRVTAIPGLSVMDMPSTYLTWVDFSGTGMSPDEITSRILNDARVGPSPGKQFGMGGELYNRFNIAMPRPLMIEAIERLEAAFSDLQ